MNWRRLGQWIGKMRMRGSSSAFGSFFGLPQNYHTERMDPP